MISQNRNRNFIGNLHLSPPLSLSGLLLLLFHLCSACLVVEKPCKNVKEFHQLIYFRNRDLLDFRRPLPTLLEPSSIENTKDVLIVASFIHLEHKEHVKV